MAGKKRLFFNRELSWLEFNQRVLDEALDPNVPLLERVGFLAITASNLDEFFMVRVGGLEILSGEGNVTRDPSGLTPSQQLSAVWARVRRMVRDQYECFNNRLMPELAAAGLSRISPDLLSEDQMAYLSSFFRDEVLSVVTPIAVQSDDAFPFVQPLWLNMIVRLGTTRDECSRPHVAIVPIPPCLRRLVSVPTRQGHAFVLVEDILRFFVSDIFPGVPVRETAMFRITRNADMAIHESDAPDLVARMEEVLAARRRSECVRLEVQEPASRFLVSALKKAFRVGEDKVITVPGPLDLTAFRSLRDLPGFDSLRYEPWPPQLPADPDPHSTVFEELKRSSLLLYHPYESFEPVLRFLQEAADDPD
ncbi:MAG: RNA degradosome polyphosphate kinase, partial [Kiritimatiellae bacterium]|nr:RNA degradosome polyphosphate kinase [Kiritimatiellia bacterium]